MSKPTPILYAEDNDHNAFMLKHSLALEGFALDIASNGQLALRMLEEGDYALILMDLDMPIMSGWEAIAKLKANRSPHPIPVIAISAHAIVGVREKAIATGADDFDTKPVRIDRLVERMRRLIQAAPANKSDPA